eukprot:TRINITY_DN2650_c0_g2_i1.p1 TRINITY_DN2650_c0_g2~~TRINITY_DN2650_c0_g2_i1.p1  ORF type:complete len:301 (-),score=72.10 TRINITY_DN2650_c0_g2_i1:4-816(-)
MGIRFKATIKKRGFFPRGGGDVDLEVKPLFERALQPIQLTDPGYIVSVHIRAFVSGTIPRSVAERMMSSALKAVRKGFREGVFVDEKKIGQVDYTEEIVVETYETAVGNASGLIIVAKSNTGCVYGGSALSERRSAEETAYAAASELLRDLRFGSCVDEYMQDQLIIYMALADGTSSFKCGPVSLHTSTAIHFTRLMTGCSFDKRDTTPEEKKFPGEKSFIITCKGIGWTSNKLDEEAKKQTSTPEDQAASETKEQNEKEGEEEEEKGAV